MRSHTQIQAGLSVEINTVTFHYAPEEAGEGIGAASDKSVKSGTFGQPYWGACTVEAIPVWAWKGAFIMKSSPAALW